MRFVYIHRTHLVQPWQHEVRGRSRLARVATISLGSDWSLRCNPDGSFHSLMPRHAAKKALKRALTRLVE
jgi:hypothetical protein